MAADLITKRGMLQLVVLSAISVGVSRLLRSDAPLGRDISSNAAVRAILSDVVAPRWGPADADLTMAVFSDYQCSACRQAAPEMQAAVVDDGNVRVVYKEWPIFGPISERAARVAVASDHQDIYHLVHQALMSRDGPLNEAELRKAIDSAGGSWREAEEYLASYFKEVDRQLERTSIEASALGIVGTPAYLVGSLLIVGGLTADQFGNAFSQARQKQHVKLV